MPAVALTDVDQAYPELKPRGAAVALANPWPEPASVEIDLVNESGEVLNMASFDLPACGQVAKFTHEFFPDMVMPDRGYLRIRAITGSIAAAGISTAGGLISTIAAN
jgi:hypothetical protein